MLRKRDKKLVILFAMSGVFLQHLILYVASLTGDRDWAGLLRRGDGYWYLWIAEHGYSVGQLLGDANFNDPKSNYVFYPMFPGLIKVGTYLGLSPQHSAILLNAVSVVVTAVLLYSFLTYHYSPFVSIAVPAMWVFQPFAVVLVTTLTETLFALFTVMILLAIQQKNEWLASLGVVAVCLTRTTGAAIALAVLIYYLVQCINGSLNFRLLRPKVWVLLATSFVSPFIYPAYVGMKLNRWDGYFYLQNEQWNSRFDAGKSNILKTIDSLNIFDDEPTATRLQIVAIAILISTVLFLLLLVAREPILVWLPTLGVLAIAISQAAWFHVKQRFLVPAFFLFIPVAKWLEPRSTIVKVATGVSFLVMTVSMTWWISLYYRYSL